MTSTPANNPANLQEDRRSWKPVGLFHIVKHWVICRRLWDLFWSFLFLHIHYLCIVYVFQTKPSSTVILFLLRVPTWNTLDHTYDWWPAFSSSSSPFCKPKFICPRNYHSSVQHRRYLQWYNHSIVILLHASCLPPASSIPSYIPLLKLLTLSVNHLCTFRYTFTGSSPPFMDLHHTGLQPRRHSFLPSVLWDPPVKCSWWS